MIQGIVESISYRDYIHTASLGRRVGLISAQVTT